MYSFTIPHPSTLDPPVSITRLESIGWVVASRAGHLYVVERGESIFYNMNAGPGQVLFYFN
jgi:hypothetical protein